MMATLYLLCGLPASGKTTWAKEMEATGALRLSLDEEALTRLADRRDTTHDLRVASEGLWEMHDEVSREHLKKAAEALRSGRSVILDHGGLWRRATRDAAKRLAETNGATWRLLYFKIDPEEQWRRLDARNRGDLSDTHFISRAEMDEFATRFEPPSDEGEEVVVA